MLRGLFAALAFGGLSAPPASAIAQEPVAAIQAVSPGDAVRDFLTAFNNLDEGAFDASFADDATAFFPEAGMSPSRADGKSAVLAIFHPLFASLRDSREGPPYLNISPAGLLIQEFGDIAVASFSIAGAGDIGHRTLVLHRESGAWRIAHLHASRVELEVSPATHPAGDPLSDPEVSPALLARVNQVPALFNREIGVDGFITPGGLARVSAAQFARVFKQATDRRGRALGVRDIRSVDAHTASFVVDFERGSVLMRVGMAEEPSDLVQEFLILGPAPAPR